MRSALGSEIYSGPRSSSVTRVLVSIELGGSFLVDDESLKGGISGYCREADNAQDILQGNSTNFNCVETLVAAFSFIVTAH